VRLKLRWSRLEFLKKFWVPGTKWLLKRFVNLMMMRNLIPLRA